MQGRGEQNRAWRLKGASRHVSMRKAGWARGGVRLRWPHGTGGGEWFPHIPALGLDYTSPS